LKINSLLLTGFSLFIFLAGLFITAVMVKKEGIENLLLITSAQFSSRLINVNRIEEFIESEFLVTYEILSSEIISLPHDNYPVTVIGTNSCYLQILGLPVSEGSFFSKHAWVSKQRHAVLNEKAAFTIFGSNKISGNQFRLRNDTWIVTGVINDADDETSRIYVPSSILNAQVGSFMALMAPNKGYDETYLKDSLKTMGILQTNYDFYNLSLQVKLLFDRFFAVVLLLSSILFICILIKNASALKKIIIDLRIELKDHYAKDILIKKNKMVFKAVWFILLVISCPVMSIYLFLRCAAVILPWKDIPSLTVNREIFYNNIIRLYNYEIISRYLFYSALVLLFVFAVNLFMTLSRKNIVPKPTP